MIKSLIELLAKRFTASRHEEGLKHKDIKKHFDKLNKFLIKEDIASRLTKKQVNFLFGDDLSSPKWVDKMTDMTCDIFGIRKPVKECPLPENITDWIWNSTQDELVFRLMTELKKLGIDFKGIVGGGIYRITDKSSAVFSAHLDTVGYEKNFKKNPVKSFGNDDGKPTHLYRPTKKGGTVVLGADDRAGVQIIFDMLKAGKDINFLFTMDEETGGRGATKLARDEEFVKEIEGCFIVILDRKGDGEVIAEKNLYCKTDMSRAIIELNDKIPGSRPLYVERGVWCDADIFCRTGIPCVNLSVGYQNAHSPNETLVLEWFENTRKTALNIADHLTGPFLSPLFVDVKNNIARNSSKGISGGAAGALKGMEDGRASSSIAAPQKDEA